jgi:hypothetical protein
MSNYTESFDRIVKEPKFYSSVGVGGPRYNPQVIYYYNSNNELLMVEEIYNGMKWTQTISGSNYANQTISRSVTYSAWVKTTVS